jgi:hypothetical protein
MKCPVCGGAVVGSKMAKNMIGFPILYFRCSTHGEVLSKVFKQPPITLTPGSFKQSIPNELRSTYRFCEAFFEFAQREMRREIRSYDARKEEWVERVYLVIDKILNGTATRPGTIQCSDFCSACLSRRLVRAGFRFSKGLLEYWKNSFGPDLRSKLMDVFTEMDIPYSISVVDDV